MIGDYSIVFLGVAGFAVFFVALAKAGFGGMIASLAMPLVAAFSDITTAISVLLPTYIVMDIILAWVYRKSVPYAMLWPMAAAGIVSLPGMMTGQILAGQEPVQAVRYQIMIFLLLMILHLVMNALLEIKG